MKKATILLSFLVFSITGFAQGKSTQETIDYINTKYPDRFKVHVEKEREMSIDFYKGGENYRTDRIYLETLDADKTGFSEEEGSLILRCREELGKGWKKFEDGCIERTFHNKGKASMYARVNIHIPNEDKGLENAFNHLIRIAQDEGEYEYVETFE